jgi:hypothetical protein
MAAMCAATAVRPRTSANVAGSNSTMLATRFGWHSASMKAAIAP